MVCGVQVVLKHLVARHRMAVVTSSRRIDFETIHARTGFLAYFEHTISADEVRETKPSPEGYLLGLATLGATPGDTIAIEDSQRGLTAARSAGLRCVAIPTALTRDQDFSGALTVLANIRELPGFIASLDR